MMYIACSFRYFVGKSESFFEFLSYTNFLGFA